MEKGYFAAAWGDVTKSPGWASVVLRLGLLCLIPIFGVVVMYGYLFSWARDIAWNVHRPLPRRYLPTKTEASISVAFSSSLLRWFFLSFQSSLTYLLACLPAFIWRHSFVWVVCASALWLHDLACRQFG